MENTEKKDLLITHFNAMSNALYAVVSLFYNGFKERGVKNHRKTMNKTDDHFSYIRESSCGIMIVFYAKALKPIPGITSYYQMKIQLHLLPNEEVGVLFQWRSSSDSDDMIASYRRLERLSDPAALDMMAKFLKGRVKRDEVSRKKFIQDFRKITE